MPVAGSARASRSASRRRVPTWCSSAGPDSQTETEKLVRDLGRDVEVVELDLADHAAVAAVGAQISAEHEVDILVNNAGIIDRHDAVDVTEDSWNAVLDVNLSGLFFLTQQLGRPMVERGHGKIVSIASLLSFQGGIRVVSYTASKHGVAGITKALANEWGPRGVQVNAIAPGYMATDNTHSRCATTPTARARSSSGSRQDGGAPPRTSPARPCSSAPRRPTTSTGTSSSWTGAGWRADRAGTPDVPDAAPAAVAHHPLGIVPPEFLALREEDQR